MQKQQALNLLMDLSNRGVTESQIVQLINFAGEWDRYWRANGNHHQPNNGSSNAGVGYGANFSTAQMIKLNLLKSTTSNMLNRMGKV